MDPSTQSAAGKRQENVINILVFQQCDSPVVHNSKVGSSSHTSGFHRIPIANTASGDITADSSFYNLPSMSVSNSKGRQLRMSNVQPVSSLYKSHSFSSFGQGDEENSLLSSGFFAVQDSADPLSSPTVPIGNKKLSQQTHKRKQGKGRTLKKHKSANIPAHVQSKPEGLSPGYGTQDLNRTSIQSLAGTPDSGFWSPTFNLEELPNTASTSSTPTSSRVGAAFDRNSETPVNFKSLFHSVVKTESEEPTLDQSLNSVQWLQTFSVGQCTTKPLETSPPARVMQPLPVTNQRQVIQSSQLLAVPLSSTTSMLGLTSISPLPNQSSIMLPYSLKQQNPAQELKSGSLKIIKTKYERPGYSYKDLIKMALQQSESGQLTLKEILAWIEDHFPYFKYEAKQSWKNSVRYNLSLHIDFTKGENQDKRNGGKWKMVDQAKMFTQKQHKPPVVKQQPPAPDPGPATKVYRTSLPRILPKAAPYSLFPLSLSTFSSNTQMLFSHPGSLPMLQQQPQPAIKLALPAQHWQPMLPIGSDKVSTQLKYPISKLSTISYEKENITPCASGQIQTLRKTDNGVKISRSGNQTGQPSVLRNVLNENNSNVPTRKFSSLRPKGLRVCRKILSNDKHSLVAGRHLTPPIKPGCGDHTGGVQPDRHFEAANLSTNRTISASEIVFRGLSNPEYHSCSGTFSGAVTSSAVTAATFSGAVTSSAVTGIPNEESSSPCNNAVSQKSKMNLCSKRSRRKQVHTPMIFDVSPDKSKPVMKLLDGMPQQSSTCSTTLANKSAVPDSLSEKLVASDPNHSDSFTMISDLQDVASLNITRLLSDQNLTSWVHLSDEECKSPLLSSIQLSPVTVSPTSPATLRSVPGCMTQDPHFCPNQSISNSISSLASSPEQIFHNQSLSPSNQSLRQLFSLACTPPAGHQTVPLASTPTHALHLPSDIQHVSSSSPGLFNSSLFENLDSFMHSSLNESFKA